MKFGALMQRFSEFRTKKGAVGWVVVFTILAQVVLYWVFHSAAEQRAKTENRELEYQRAIEMEVATRVNLK